MKYTRSYCYPEELIRQKIMGPNPLKLTEELLQSAPIPAGTTVLDLGSGTGITSLFLAQQYGYHVFAADLWSDPGENMRFFESMGLDAHQIVPLKADANALPFATRFFDAVVSTDSYNYFGREAGYLENHLLPFVKPGGWVYICVPGMKRDLHEQLPEALLRSWTAEQMEYMHDARWWRTLIAAAPGVEGLSVWELEGNEEPWADWLACENDYARGDRASIEAGALQYLNFIGIKFCVGGAHAQSQI